MMKYHRTGCVRDLFMSLILEITDDVSGTYCLCSSEFPVRFFGITDLPLEIMQSIETQQ